MSEAQRALAGEYLDVLRGYLGGAGEGALNDAYELGRKAIDGGLGVMDVAAIHHEALASVLRKMTTPEEGARATRNAALVESESLSVFEMALRGYREVNSELSRSNAQLRTLAAELQESARAEREARMELQRANQELQRAQGQLVQSAKLAALGQLVAGVAHEINNPLAFVVNNIAVLRRDARSLVELLELYRAADPLIAEHGPERHRAIRELAERVDAAYVLANLEELIARSRDGLKRIQRIVQDLRNFARVEDGELQEVTDFMGGVESTLNIVRGQARDRGVELTLEPAELPPFVCAPSKVNQVVLNLVANAVDACGAGGRVTVRATAGEGEVQVHVEDTGEGIDPAIRDRIFDPFFTTKPQGQGTGLGLSISHGIVAEHGGRIEVESAPGRGAHFTVHLPLRPPVRPPAGRP